jgi:hypothetical protein
MGLPARNREVLVIQIPGGASADELRAVVRRPELF